MGVRVRRGVTFHGFSLNVDPNMAHWDLIIPCGITDGGVTSLGRELSHAPCMAHVRSVVAHHFGELFGLATKVRSLDELPLDGDYLRWAS
jgi:lipoate-protein ligase B